MDTPQLAQVAIQHGDRLASNLIKEADNKPMEAFAYKVTTKAAWLSFPKYKAVVDLPKFFLPRGLGAWLVWLFIHIIPLIGFLQQGKTGL